LDRTFLYEDVLHRYLEYLGYRVQRMMNFTDVEDKAVAEARKQGVTVHELTSAVEERFLEECLMLGIKIPEIARSSTSVEQAVRLIRILMDKGFAYRHEGDVFYDPLKFKGFGKLFGLDMSRWPKEKRRFRKDTYPGRRWNLGDFILWRRVRGDSDNPSWETELGRGRPAWNVQDAAMVTKHLGDRIDIACGGVDNLYRHHDYTIAVEEGKCYDLFSVLCLIAFFPLSLGLSLYTMQRSPPSTTPCDFSGGTSTTSRPLRKTSRKNGRTRPSGFSSGKERKTRTGPGWRRARAPSHLGRYATLSK
jgi:cysteinyl-tRNA synthetase